MSPLFKHAVGGIIMIRLGFKKLYLFFGNCSLLFQKVHGNFNVVLLANMYLYHLYNRFKFGGIGIQRILNSKQLSYHISQCRAIWLWRHFFLKYKILKINDLVDINQAIFMYYYTHKLIPASFENIFKKFGNFERSLNYQLDIL